MPSRIGAGGWIGGSGNTAGTAGAGTPTGAGISREDAGETLAQLPSEQLGGQVLVPFEPEHSVAHSGSS